MLKDDELDNIFRNMSFTFTFIFLCHQFSHWLPSSEETMEFDPFIVRRAISFAGHEEIVESTAKFHMQVALQQVFLSNTYIQQDCD